MNRYKKTRRYAGRGGERTGYAHRVVELAASGVVPRPGVTHVQVLHEPWCPRLRNEPCECVPDVRPFTAAELRAAGLHGG